MFTQIVKLTFKDGQEVTAQVTVETPYDDGQVKYEGAYDRLPDRPSQLGPSTLVGMFKSIADKTGAELAGSTKGSYRYAE